MDKSLIAIIFSVFTIAYILGGVTTYNSMNTAYREALFEKIKYGR